MKKLIQWGIKTFITKKFLTFGVFGVVNTLIHMAVYYVFFNLFTAGAFISNTVAFITASTFSYFANAIFTFKPTQRNATQFSLIMVVFFIRLMISNGLTVLFDNFVQNGLGIDYSWNRAYSLIAPFSASALLIPIAFFAMGYVFKKTDSAKKE